MCDDTRRGGVASKRRVIFKILKFDDANCVVNYMFINNIYLFF